MEYEPKEILTRGGDSISVREIQPLPSPKLPVWSVLSVNSVNVDIT